MDWLSQLNPNLVIAALLVIVGYLEHRFLSPEAQAKVASAVAGALGVADQVLDALVAASPAGTTKEQLELELWAAVKTQLAHVGLDVDKLPPAVADAATALVQKYLAAHATKPEDFQPQMKTKVPVAAAR